MSASGTDSIHIEKNELYKIANNFWNIRVSFKMFAGRIDLGSKMSLIRLNNEKFLVIDTIISTEQTRSSIDHLTENGTKIKVVIGVHPFHVLAFPAFYQAYPNAQYYSTPKHLRRLTEIPWAGSLDDCCEFINPLPESNNHFVSVFVFHCASHTLHVDDTIIYGDPPGFLLKLIGFKNGTMSFYPSIKGPGLYPTVESPFQFRDWMKSLLNDWPFDNICCAHSGVKTGGAPEQVVQLVNNAERLFQKLSEKHRKKNPENEIPAENHPNLNVSGNECG